MTKKNNQSILVDEKKATATQEKESTESIIVSADNLAEIEQKPINSIKTAKPQRVAPAKPGVQIQVQAMPKGVVLCQKELLAILGTAGSLSAAPFENDEFEMWAVAVCTTFPACKRWDLLFELHTEGYWHDKNILARLKRAKAPIYMQEKFNEVPNSIRYPIEAIKQYRPYHTTSITYMLALAYHSYLATGKPKHVALFGIHMEHREEYTEQRPCCEYWLGRMEAVGIDVEPSPGGAILASQGMYGYENYDPICYEIKKRIEGLRRGMAKVQDDEKRAFYEQGKQEGGLLENEYWLRRIQKGDFPRG